MGWFYKNFYIRLFQNVGHKVLPFRTFVIEQIYFDRNRKNTSYNSPKNTLTIKVIISKDSWKNAGFNEKLESLTNAHYKGLVTYDMPFRFKYAPCNFP